MISHDSSVSPQAMTVLAASTILSWLASLDWAALIGTVAMVIVAVVTSGITINERLIISRYRIKYEKDKIRHDGSGRP